ncbi:MAG: metalloregulator ArsR/SmtB family transcription factor [Bacteroidota bacterium]|nr:metalloregulator ArsR/SmtB family transcription factor [Bacteroidota bacterium]
MEQHELLAELFTALGHANRLKILAFLRDGERCQCELPEAMKLEQSNISRHVKILVSAGILRSRKDGTRTMLRVANPVILDLLDDTEKIALDGLKTRIKAFVP